MKIKNKGKVYPSPSSSSSSSSNGDYLSVLKLLPAAILALASVLSLEDREVLAYLITRSIKTTTPTNSTSSSIIQRKSSKKAAAAANGNGNSGNTNNNSNTHKPPVFDCDCFDCYTSYWFRWDSSPNRELIHQAIEAFEDHLTNGEREKSKKNNGKAKRRDKTARRFADKNQVVAVEDTLESSCGNVAAAVVDVTVTSTVDVVAAAPMSSPEEVNTSVEENEVVAADVSGESTVVEEEEEEIPAAAAAAAAAASSCSHKGLARKVLPDVLGLFNSRLWSLWNPNA